MQQKPCHWRPRENPNPELVVNRPRTVRIDLLSNTVPNIRHLVRKHAYRRRTVQTAVGPGILGSFSVPCVPVPHVVDHLQETSQV